MIPDTTIVRDLTPSARVFGIEYQDLIFVLSLFLPIGFLVWLIFPPLIINFDAVTLLGGKAGGEPPQFNLTPWVPTFFLWIVISLSYLKIREGKPRGYLLDFYQELNDFFELLAGSDPHFWEGGRPDTEIDRYWLD
ncbi:hypothetical protein [Anthocerotibacter panamensis]|uniref:hypothetical protein n=1 Tax=Anthocerotibacter panamensis TaxID=2857077 RepID=UPI001C402CD6|nr:hypothetical protein [Anthocerotibacter panamensis]